MRDNHAVQEWIRYAESAYVLANKGKVSTKVLYNVFVLRHSNQQKKLLRHCLSFIILNFLRRMI